MIRTYIMNTVTLIYKYQHTSVTVSSEMERNMNGICKRKKNTSVYGQGWVAKSNYKILTKYIKKKVLKREWHGQDFRFFSFKIKERTACDYPCELNFQWTLANHWIERILLKEIWERKGETGRNIIWAETNSFSEPGI